MDHAAGVLAPPHLVDYHFVLHELIKAAHVQAGVHRRNERFLPLVQPDFNPVFGFFFEVVFLEVVDDCDVVDVLACLRHVLVPVSFFILIEVRN